MNSKMLDEETEYLFSNIEEAAERAENGICVSSPLPFLTPAEQYFITERLKYSGYISRAYFYGGYESAERRSILFLPDYLLPQERLFENPKIPVTDEEAEKSELICAQVRELYGRIKISGSGYRVLSHRDYMGAILNLGIERAVIGDIVVTGDFEAVVFAAKKIIPFITESLKKAASDTVRAVEFPLDLNFVYERKFAEITDTIASPRLDGTVAALASLSRDKSLDLILRGDAEVNYTQIEKPDFKINDGDIVTIRGCGKFIIDSVSEKSKKGRLRLKARKYI